MKTKLLLITFLSAFTLQSQTITTGANTIASPQRTEHFIPNSPLNTVGNRVVTEYEAGTARRQFNQSEIAFTGYAAGAERVATILANGNLSTQPLTNFAYASTDGVTKTGNTFSLDWGYVMSHENWAVKADTSSVWTRSQSDLRYKAIGWFPNWTEVTGKPSLFDGDYNSLTNRPTLFSGSYTDLTNKPTLFGGAYSDLTGKPTLFSGAYSDLTGKPDLSVYYLASNPSGFISSVPAQSWTSVTGKPTFATVATSGDYTDLINKPTIPTNNNQLTNGAGYLTTQDAYTAGFGILKSGSTPSYTLAVDTSTLMTVTAANTAIADMTTNINGKVPNTRTISINGTSQDLSANRTWTGIGIEIPSQTGNNGKVLSTDGSAVSWQTPTAAYVPTITNAVSRPINSTTFTVSTTKQAFVAYNVNISCTATIGSAASGSVALQYSTNAGSSWNTVGTVSNSNTVTLAVVLNSVQVSGLQVSGYVPANALCRMVSTSSGVNAVISYLSGMEVY